MVTIIDEPRPHLPPFFQPNFLTQLLPGCKISGDAKIDALDNRVISWRSLRAFSEVVIRPVTARASVCGLFHSGSTDTSTLPSFAF
jgi:hypothetical protein